MYYCQMPGCDYQCDSKSQINQHHIIPKSLGGDSSSSNIIDLCPNCHYRVYVPGMGHGIHSITHDNSVILNGKFMSTSGMVISYQQMYSDITEYSLLTTKD